MLYIVADHAGYKLKNHIIELCKAKGIEIVDLYKKYDPADDYPDMAAILAQKMLDAEDEDLGIALCGTAEGICMALNRFSHIRAVTCYDPHIARITRMHNHANVLCIPGDYTDKKMNDHELMEVVETFIYTEPDLAARHLRRIQKLSKWGEG